MAAVAGTVDSRAAAEAYLGGICFKVGPPARIGAELEWLTVLGDGERSRAERPGLARFAAALGPHAPTTIAPDSPARPLPHGSYVTLEPGGQIELSSLPAESAAELCAALAADVAALSRLLGARGIRLAGAAADVHRPPRRLLAAPRYRAMEARFVGIGPFGVLMMCNTAATQVCVDAGADAAEIAARWRCLYAVGPALVAAFACSPRLHGAPGDAWASQRMRTWLHLDPSRTAPPPGSAPADYPAWVLDVPLLCVRRTGADWSAPAGATFGDWIDGALDAVLGRRPTLDDLRYHLTTLFPPVRPAGHLEVRYLDAQPGAGWAVPILAVAALMSAPEVVAEATVIAAGTAERWHEAAHDGLGCPELRTAAGDLLELAAAHSGRPDALGAAARRCRRGIDPTRQEAA